MMPPASSSNTEFSRSIESDADTLYVSHRAKSLAKGAGFSSKAQWEIAISVSEAATNILKYGERGQITLRLEADYFEFEALDHGEGFEDLERAQEDGISQGKSPEEVAYITSRTGLGAGLGAIARMMDQLTIENRPEGGAILTARKFL